MRQIWTLIKLQFKSRVALSKGAGHKRNLKLALIAMLLAGVLAGFVYVYYILALNFVDHSWVNPDHEARFDLSRPFLIFTLVIFAVIQTVFLIPSLVRNLDLNNDRELLLKLPVSPRQIFASKVIVQYIFEVVFATIVLLPILIAYAMATGMFTTGMNWGYVFYFPLIILLVPVIPFFLATLFLYPATKLVQFLRSRTILTSLGYLVGLVGGIVLYMYIIEAFMFAITDEANFPAFLMTTYAEGTMAGIANAFFPQALFANLVGGYGWATALWSIATIIGMAVVLLTISYFVAGALYKKTYQDEGSGTITIRKESQFKQGSPMNATFKKDMKNISRSSNYTFQFLLLVIITPLIVYFVNRVAMFSSYQSFRFHRQATEAGGMLFGVSLFVLLVLLPLACSFAASNITREGHNIYHTKLIPQSFRKQLVSKVVIVLVPILAAIGLSIGLIMIPYRPDPVDADMVFNLVSSDAVYLFFVSILMAIGYVTVGTYLDLRRPLCNQVGGGELTKTTAHINTIMGVGIAFGAIMGVLAMIGGFGLEVFGEGWLTVMADIGGHVWWVVLAVAVTFATVGTALLFFRGPKKYAQLEQ